MFFLIIKILPWGLMLVEALIIFLLSIIISRLRRKNKLAYLGKLTDLNNVRRKIQKEAKNYDQKIKKAQNSNDYINIYNDIVDNIMSDNSDNN